MLPFLHSLLLLLTTWMDLEGIMLSEINQTVEDIYCMISFICGIFKEKKKPNFGTSLVVKWLRFLASNAGGPGSIPGQGTRSHMLQQRSYMRQWRSPVPQLRHSAENKFFLKPNFETVKWWLPRAAGWGKWGDDGHRVQASSYKINKLWDSKAQHGDYS